MSNFAPQDFFRRYGRSLYMGEPEEGLRLRIFEGAPVVINARLIPEQAMFLEFDESFRGLKVKNEGQTILWLGPQDLTYLRKMSVGAFVDRFKDLPAREAITLRTIESYFDTLMTSHQIALTKRFIAARNIRA